MYDTFLAAPDQAITNPGGDKHKYSHKAWEAARRQSCRLPSLPHVHPSQTTSKLGLAGRSAQGAALDSFTPLACLCS
jgi:hypothetical protein